MKKIYEFFKRITDIIVSLVLGLIFLLPCVIIAVAIKSESKGPVLFKQKRVGKGKKTFTMYKFRSMRNDAPHETATHLLASAQSYITKTGAFLRKTSMDEIPQLINIFLGDMSFVGPRPALWNQFDLLAERDKYKANDVKPGLTGWAQINGRDDISIEEKSKLDGEYVEKRNYWFDAKIFVKTFTAALSGKNVSDSEAVKDKNHMNILVVCQYFYPETFRINSICEELVKKGHNVTVLTGTPNYPKGKIFEGYEKGKKSHEVMNGIEIYRAKIIPRGNSNPVRMVLNYYSFVFSGKRLAGKLCKEKKFDQVFVYQLSPALMAFPALKVAKKQKIPMMMYILDMWPESVQNNGKIKSKLIISVLNKRLQKIYDKCDKVLISSRSFKNILLERNCCPEEKIEYWPQFCEKCYFPLEKNKKTDDFVIMFAGNIGRAQGMDIILDCAKKLNNPKIKWVIVGDGSGKDDIEERIKKENLEDSIIVRGRVSMKEVTYMLSEADVAFMALKGNLSKITLPAKLQSYFACGKPVLASVGRESEIVIEESGAGLCSPPGDVEALTENVLKMYNMTEEELNAMAKKAAEYSKKEFDIEKLMDILEKDMQDLL